MDAGTQVVASSEAVFAGLAGDAWLESDAVPRLQRADGRTTLLYNACRLMTENQWLFDLEVADLPVGPVVNLEAETGI
jgi:hypothetical protein